MNHTLPHRTIRKKQKRHLKQQLPVFFILLAAIPLTIAAVLTQRTELRKRAFSNDQPTVCWNRVVQSKGSYIWPNGCKGNPENRVCTQAAVALSPAERYTYLQWVNDEKSYQPGCENEQMPTQTSISPTPAAEKCTEEGSPCNVTACPTCTPGKPCPLKPCSTTNGVCRESVCTSLPAGCFWEKVTCIQEPCTPVLTCPTQAPGQWPKQVKPGRSFTITFFDHLLNQFKKIESARESTGDVNNDGNVNLFDYNTLLQFFRK